MKTNASTFRRNKKHLDALDMRRNTSIQARRKEGMPTVGKPLAKTRKGFRIGNMNPL